MANPITPGPYWEPRAACGRCGATLAWSEARDDWVDQGGALCPPPSCIWQSVSRYGLSWVNYAPSGHTGMCACTSSGIAHTPIDVEPYPWPERIPWCCGDPMRLTRASWICRRSACSKEVPTGSQTY